MLVLSRKEGQSIVIDERIKIVILGVRSNVARVGIDAPIEIPIVREELEFRGDVKFASDKCSARVRGKRNQIAESGGYI